MTAPAVQRVPKGPKVRQRDGSGSRKAATAAHPLLEFIAYIDQRLEGMRGRH
jgi:hypothetical protein